ncbi:MAG: hypothetical protein LBN08_01235 [Lactobacillales bacterium]|nr:hypothetical protein [Lactobacillales bacterium]
MQQFIDYVKENSNEKNQQAFAALVHLISISSEARAAWASFALNTMSIDVNSRELDDERKMSTLYMFFNKLLVDNRMNMTPPLLARVFTEDFPFDLASELRRAIDVHTN